MPHQRLLVLFTIPALFVAGVVAQWWNYLPPETPRKSDGKVNLAAPAPRPSPARPRPRNGRSTMVSR